MKKALKLLVVVFGIFMALSCVAACNNDNKEDEEPKVKAELVLSSEKLQITEDNSYQLTVMKSDNSAVGTLTWESDDEDIAIVENGLVTGVLAGNATITVTEKSSNLSASCEVTVLASADYPSIELSQYDAKLMLEDSIVITPTVKYKGSTVRPMPTIVAESNNEDVATVEVNSDGEITITSEGLGEAVISVSTTYKNKTTQREVSVEVVEDISFALNKSAGDLYTYNYNADYPKTEQLEVSLTVNGDEITEAQIDWTSDEEGVATVNDGLVTATGVGEATITAKYTSVSGNEYTADFIVTVYRTSIKLDKVVDIFLDINDGDNVMSFGDDLEIEKPNDLVIKDANDATVSYSEVTGGITLDLACGDYMLKFISDTDQVDFEAEIAIITKVIKTAEELKNLTDYGSLTNVDTSKNLFKHFGYFILGNNIDATGYTFNRAFNTTSDPDFGLNGGFDGRGYTVYNALVKAGGVFGSIARGSVVKNVAFVNMTYGYSGNGSIFGENNYGTIDNCLIEVVKSGSDGQTYCAMSGFCNLNYGTISNCVSYYPVIGDAAAKAICQYNYTDAEILNTYAITDDDTVYAVGGTVDVKKFAYGTKREDMTISGLGDCFDLTKEYITFKTTTPFIEELEKASVTGIEATTVSLFNTDVYTLPITMDNVNYEILNLDSQYEQYLTINAKKKTITVADTVEDFTFSIKYYWTKDDSVNKVVSYTVSQLQVLSKPVDIFLDSNDGDKVINVVEDLGITAATSYTLVDFDTNTPISFTPNGAELTLSLTEAGEKDVVLTADGKKVRFVLVVVTAKIDSYAEFISARDANTVSGVWSGYYILGNSIDIPTDTAYNCDVTTFSGIFDGRGNAVNGGFFHTGTKSLFGDMTGTVKNTAFLGVKIGIIEGLFKSISGLVDNCLIDGYSIGDYNNISPIYNLTPNGTISNTIIYFNDANVSAGNKRGGVNMMQGTTKNVYVFSGKLTGWDNRTNKTGATLYAYNAGLPTGLTGFNDYWDLTGTKAQFKK